MDNAYTDVARSETQLLVRFASGQAPSQKPGNTVPPVISGIPAVGQTLFSTSGTWTKDPTSYTYVWYWNTEPIGIGNTYTLIALDIGGMITCKVSATNAQGTSSYATSNALGPVVAGGSGLLFGEANGFATDFLYATDAERVALKASNVVTKYAIDSFYQNSSTSPKMVYDSAGVLRWSPHNRVVQSSMGRLGFEAVGNGATRTGGQPDPLGGNEALQVVTTANLGLNAYVQSGGIDTVGVTYTGSAWCKGTAGQQIRFATGMGPDYQLLVTFTGAWQRVSLTGVANATSQYLGFELYDRVGSAHLPNVTFLCFGAQFNLGTVPTAYLPTTTVTRIGLALDYDPVTHAPKGLLCEPAGTNLAVQSNDVSVMTAEGGTATLNNQTGPEGTLTADTFTENTAGGVPHAMFGATTTTLNADYTLSAFYKMGTRRYATIGFSNGTNGAYAVYDLQTGVVGSSAAIGAGPLNSASIQAVGNGWYRCVLSAKAPGTNTYYTYGAATSATITQDGYGRQAFTGTSSTFFLGHRQIEAGTVATSPIPTLAAQVTRAADRYNFLPAQINHSATAGSWWAEVYLYDAGATDRFIVGLHTNSVSPLFYNNSAFEILQGTLLYILTPAINAVYKAMTAFQSGDRAITAKGLTPVTDAGATSILLAPTALWLGTDTSGGNPIIGYIRKHRYLPRRPSGAEMQTMTEPDYIPITLAAPVSPAPAGKMTWNAGTGVLTLVGALGAETCTANFGPVATIGKTYRIRFNVDVLAGDSFSFLCGNTMAGQISTTGAKTFTLVATGPTPVISIIEWGGSLTDLTLSNIRVDEVVTA